MNTILYLDDAAYDGLWMNWNRELKRIGWTEPAYIGDWIKRNFDAEFDWATEVTWYRCSITFKTAEEAIIFKLQGWLTYDRNN